LRSLPGQPGLPQTAVGPTHRTNDFPMSAPVRQARLFNIFIQQHK
jgi:hypothetical protein